VEILKRGIPAGPARGRKECLKRCGLWHNGQAVNPEWPQEADQPDPEWPQEADQRVPAQSQSEPSWPQDDEDFVEELLHEGEDEFEFANQQQQQQQRRQQLRLQQQPVFKTPLATVDLRREDD